jgi:Porin subfamily
VSYNDAATAIVCNNAVANGTGTWSLTNDTACNPGYSEWGFGSRTQWNVTKDFYMGVDVYYVKLQPEMSGTVFVNGSVGAKPGGTYFVEDQDNVGTRVRFHRDIVP